MADNSRDVALNLNVNTSGTGELDNLAEGVKKIGTGATDASAELEQLAQASATAAQAEAAAAAEAKQAREALNSQRDALALTKIAYRESGGDADAYRASIAQLEREIVAARAALREKTAALSDAKSATLAARAAEQEFAAAQAQAAAAAKAATEKQAAANTQFRDSVHGLSDQLATLQNLVLAITGGSVLGGLAKGVADTADNFANLSARIKLASGDGAAFSTALQGVQDIALRTSTSLDATATLFTRLSQAGKEMGLSQEQALQATEAFTQSAQVAGATAEESARSAIQFSQAIAATVLRGQDLNSVMEQNPRLAKALADGLGVAVGELKKLGETGQLTSQQVIGALLGQAATLRAEFSQLPPTIGRAITDLGTAWEVYVGQASQASGASATVASAIETVAHNLSTLTTILLDAGKAALAYKAINIAQAFIDKAIAVRAATVAIEANTTATAANSAAQTANVAATERAAAGASRFASILGSLKLGAFLAVVTNPRDIGTWIGESAAKLAGYGKAIEDLEIKQRAISQAAREMAAQNAQLAQAMQLAAERALGLDAESKRLVASFEKVRTEGGSVTDAVQKLAKELQLGDVRGITEAGAALDALAVRGKIAADQVRDAWAGALKGVDLGVFTTQARAAFDDTEQGARRLAAALDAVSQEALRRAGTSVEELRTGFSKLSTSAINDVDSLVKALHDMGATGDDAGRAIATALDKATDAAGTERAVQAVIDRFADLGRQGAISGEQLAAGLAKAQAKLDAMVPGVNSLAEALHAFGLKSQAELQATADKFASAWKQIENSTTIALQDKIAAFQKFRDAAIAANNGIEPSDVALQRRILESQADVQGLGDKFESAMQRGAKATETATQAVGDLTTQLETARDAAQRAQAALNGTLTAGQIGKSNKVNNADDDPSRGPITGSYDAGAYWQLLLKQQAGTLDAGDFNLAKVAYETAVSNLQSYTAGNQAFNDFGALQSAEEMFNKSKAIYEQLKALQSDSGSSSPAPSTSHTVTINLGNKSTTINTASANDAQALSDLLRQLETAAGRTGP